MVDFADRVVEVVDLACDLAQARADVEREAEARYGDDEGKESVFHCVYLSAPPTPVIGIYWVRS